ncbi:MAG: lamin tail domain-containing protein, partial [Sedimentisphaerales bacterium]|nr:lamin tail domain-containing protein [Sedimentisphaerales bacterium]
MAMTSNSKTVVALLLCGVCLTCPTRGAGAVVINEVMASNSSVRADPQGQYDDWIEIYNTGPDPVDLAGLYLTDDLEEPTRWRVPSDRPALTTIAAGGHLLIWADGDTGDPGLHAGFSIAAAGEQIAIFDDDASTLIDAVTLTQQKPDVSFGRYPDANDTWQFMAQPTPGQANVSVFEGFVADVEFSHDRGFYDRPLLVTLATDTEGATIWFTTDGSEPYDILPRTITGSPYTGPIEITSTTCLRAKAIKPGWAASTIRTHTYIFLDDVVHQPLYPAGFPRSWGESDADYAMDPDIINDPRYRDVIRDALLTHRTISLTFDPVDMFGPTQGIYVNSQEEGDEWERPVSVEIIDPGEGPEIHVNAGMKIQGSASSSPSRPKHNLRLIFKGAYGAPKLEFPVFPDWPVERFDSIHLRGGNGDSWYHPNTNQQIEAQYIRDQWSRDTQYAMGRLAPGQTYAHVYLNGLYWGLYHVIERPNASFFAEHLGGDKEEYDVLKHKNLTVAGNRQAWNAMMAIANAGLASPDAYARIQEYMDIPNLIDFMLVNFFAGNSDWDHNNWYGGRRRAPGAGFRFFTWDSERTFLNLNDNVTTKNNSNQPTRVHQQLTANADYRMLFADHVQRHFFNGGALTTDSGRDRWLQRAEEIRLALVAEAARWGDAKRTNHPYTPDEEWQTELDFLCNQYFPQRPGIVLGQLRARNLYPDIEAPTFSLHGGAVPVGFNLSLSAPGGAIWFTLDGSDPRLPQTAQSDSTTRTLVSEDASKRVLVPTEAVSDAWRSGEPFDDSTWLPVAGAPGGVGYERSAGYEGFISLDVHDLMYEGNTSCYIRIPFPFDRVLDDWDALTLRVRYDDGFVAYLNGAEIARRNLEGDPSWDSDAASGHSDAQAAQFEEIDVSAFITRLRRGENLLALHGLNVSPTSSDFLISVELELTAGGTPADVNPQALTYTGPVTLNATRDVKARVLSGGQWSALSEAVFAVGPVAESLRVSEMMYHPGDTGSPTDPNTEYVELTNVGGETIDLNLVKFTNGI